MLDNTKSISGGGTASRELKLGCLKINKEPGVALAMLGPVSLRARPFGLVAACRKGPAGRDQSAIRSSSPSGPPNARQK
jgi:hypothetical protein